LGRTPVSPIEPSTTMIIGAMARMGTVCDAMIQGIRLLSSERTWTMAAASKTPSRVPMAKPSRVGASVAHA